MKFISSFSARKSFSIVVRLGTVVDGIDNGVDVERYGMRYTAECITLAASGLTERNLIYILHYAWNNATTSNRKKKKLTQCTLFAVTLCKMMNATMCMQYSSHGPREREKNECFYEGARVASSRASFSSLTARWKWIQIRIASFRRTLLRPNVQARPYDARRCDSSNIIWN